MRYLYLAEKRKKQQKSQQQEKPDEEVTTLIDWLTSQRGQKALKGSYIDELTSIDINKQFFLHFVSALGVIFSLIGIKFSFSNTSLKDASSELKCKGQ